MMTISEIKAARAAASVKWWNKMTPEERKKRSHENYVKYRDSLPPGEYQAKRKSRDAARIASSVTSGTPLDKYARTPEQAERYRASSLAYYYRKKSERGVKINAT